MSGTNHNSSFDFRQVPNQILTNRGLVTSLILLVALIGFEMFNYSTTYVALNDLLGNLTFLGLRWATILAIAFCGIDFAGIARLFMPDEDSHLPRELWFLFGAWLLAATMNATLTWWGVSMTITNHTMESATIIDANILRNIVPIFVAMMVWVTRILLIGTFSFSGNRFVRVSVPKESVPVSYRPPISRPAHEQLQPAAFQPAAAASPSPRPTSIHRRPANPVPAPARQPVVVQSAKSRPEPEYVSDPSILTAQPAYHSLSGRQPTNGKTPHQF